MLVFNKSGVFDNNSGKMFSSSAEGLLMSTHNICFYGEIREIIPEFSPNTPGAMTERELQMMLIDLILFCSLGLIPK